MRVGAGKRRGPIKLADRRRQVNVRIEPALYRALETLARHERRSVPQAARRLMEDGLRQRLGGPALGDDTRTEEIASLARAGGAFDWLEEEPDLYDDSSGEPV